MSSSSKKNNLGPGLTKAAISMALLIPELAHTDQRFGRSGYGSRGVNMRHHNFKMARKRHRANQIAKESRRINRSGK